MVDWRALLIGDDGVELRPAATEAEIARVEALLGAVLPSVLRALYLVSDGAFDKAGEWFVLWPLDEVVRRNQQEWAEGDTARRRLVGFGDDGTGAPFCVPRDGSAGVFTWDRIDGAAYRLADTVDEFWSGWTTGAITT